MQHNLVKLTAKKLNFSPIVKEATNLYYLRTVIKKA